MRLAALLTAVLLECAAYEAAAALKWVSLGAARGEAAAFTVARFYTFDPYYLPALRRASDGGLFPSWWVYGLVVAPAAASVALLLTNRRAANALASLALLASLITSWAMYAGH